MARYRIGWMSAGKLDTICGDEVSGVQRGRIREVIGQLSSASAHRFMGRLASRG